MLMGGKKPMPTRIIMCGNSWPNLSGKMAIVGKQSLSLLFRIFSPCVPTKTLIMQEKNIPTMLNTWVSWLK